jgi:putative transposase
MPEHVHMLISEPEKGNPSDALRTLKQRMSIAMSPRFKKKSKTQPAVLKEITPTLWQPRFYDFNVRTGRKVQEKLDYMHANPVKRKLVDHCRDWPWSSWSQYEDGGKDLIRIDSLV